VPFVVRTSERHSPKETLVAKYLLFLSVSENRMASATPEEFAEMMTAHTDWAKAVADAGGTVLAGEALQPPETATRYTGGAITDAPLAETKEMINGFYLVEAPSEELAQQFARTCPGETTELRPVADLTAAPA
jgi:hypothetical protein